MKHLLLAFALTVLVIGANHVADQPVAPEQTEEPFRLLTHDLLAGNPSSVCLAWPCDHIVTGGGHGGSCSSARFRALSNALQVCAQFGCDGGYPANWPGSCTCRWNCTRFYATWNVMCGPPVGGGTGNSLWVDPGVTKFLLALDQLPPLR